MSGVEARQLLRKRRLKEGWRFSFVSCVLSPSPGVLHSCSCLLSQFNFCSCKPTVSIPLGHRSSSFASQKVIYPFTSAWNNSIILSLSILEECIRCFAGLESTQSLNQRYRICKLWAAIVNSMHGKNGFVTATKLGTDKIFVAAAKNFAAATKRFVERTKHFAVVTKCFCYPYFNKWFCQYNKTFFPVWNKVNREGVWMRFRNKV